MSLHANTRKRSYDTHAHVECLARVMAAASEPSMNAPLYYSIREVSIASFPGSPSPRTNYTRVTFDLAERLRESLVHFGT